MNAATLAIWILALPAIPDSRGFPIRRPTRAARDIAAACIDAADPARCARTLDMLCAKESTYRPELAGDCPGMRAGDPKCTREKGARSCGAFQTPCNRTPPKLTPLEQAKLAKRILDDAETICPSHPLWAYASGECKPTDTAIKYEKLIAAPIAPPDEEESDE
jgi:hypothetical protein